MTKDRYTKILNFEIPKGNLSIIIHLNWLKWVKKIQKKVPNVKPETIKFMGTIYDPS